MMEKLRPFLVRLRFSLQMAWHGVLSNRLRSLLTVLGVAIGVASVVCLMGIGEGARLSVLKQFESLGQNVIIMRSTKESSNFNPKLAYTLPERVKTLTMATPVSYGETDMRWRRSRGTIEIIGVNSYFPQIRDQKVILGSFFNELQVENNSKVAVLGYNVAAEFQGGRSPIGQTLILDGLEYRIIGVLAAKGTGQAEGIDGKVVLPYTSAQRIIGAKNVSEIWGKASSTTESDLAMVQLGRIFNQQISGTGLLSAGGDSGTATSKKSTVTITNMNQMIKETDKVNRVMTLLLGGIAAVSLLVGGLGIMNIMLVSVSERTGEIGVRRALGARQSDLLIQFVLESLYLSIAGALAGVLIGIAGMDAFTRYGFETAISFTAIRVAVGVALGCGLIFGIYPAFSASSVPPVEALRRT